MKSLIGLFVFVCFSFASAAKSNEVFYCASELAIGFQNESRVWKETRFKPERFTIKFNKDFSKVDGLDNASYECAWGYDDPKRKFLSCINEFNNGMFFNFNTSTKKFIYAQTTMFGYPSNDTDPDTNAVYAGKCNKF